MTGALNARGAERAIEAGVRTLIFVVSASQAHSRNASADGRRAAHGLRPNAATLPAMAQ